MMYQSPTQRYSRWVFIWQVPVIVCTNEWTHPQASDSLSDWIHENSVYIQVNRYLWQGAPTDTETQQVRYYVQKFDAPKATGRIYTV